MKWGIPFRVIWDKGFRKHLHWLEHKLALLSVWEMIPTAMRLWQQLRLVAN